VTRGYKHVGMRLAYFACPYPYAFVKRKCPRDAKLFYEITENKKRANEHLPQTTTYLLYQKKKDVIIA
jgi:hypothetical protein